LSADVFVDASLFERGCITTEPVFAVDFAGIAEIAMTKTLTTEKILNCIRYIVFELNKGDCFVVCVE